ncbi:MAG: thiamine phosphate synthase [Paracoccaceae bacterium]|nr:thiamine phosphate synthase [Paracoccaceae bacterium]
MTASERPQIYLLTPPEFELSVFPDQLSGILDSFEVACLRLAMASRDEDRLSRAADAIRTVAHQRDIAVVIETHVGLAERLGLDGVHLSDGARSVRAVRKALGKDAIVGAFCGTSRHDGMNAGEAGADYVAFGPAGVSILGDGTQAEPELFAWWSEMIEIPVVAEGHLDVGTIEALAPMTDFFAIGEEIWAKEDPSAALKELLEPLG